MEKITPIDRDELEKRIDRIKKRISGLNKAISLQANKIADTMTLIVISRDANILMDRIQRKKKAIEELKALRRELRDVEKVPSESET